MTFSNWPTCVLAAVTGASFALLAYKLHKGIALWCIGGVIAALCIASLCVGIAHAAAVPYTDSKIHSMQSIGIAVAVVILGLIALILALANRTRLVHPGH